MKKCIYGCHDEGGVDVCGEKGHTYKASSKYEALIALLFQLSKDITRICLENGEGKGIDYYADEIEKLYASPKDQKS